MNMNININTTVPPSYFVFYPPGSALLYTGEPGEPGEGNLPFIWARRTPLGRREEQATSLPFTVPSTLQVPACVQCMVVCMDPSDRAVGVPSLRLA